jgi:hypothetical protein
MVLIELQISPTRIAAEIHLDPSFHSPNFFDLLLSPTLPQLRFQLLLLPSRRCYQAQEGRLITGSQANEITYSTPRQPSRAASNASF